MTARRRWGIAAGGVLVAAAAVVIALVLGTEVFDARVAKVTPPATDGTPAVPGTTSPVTTPATSTSAATTPPSSPSSPAASSTAPQLPAPAPSGSTGSEPAACSAFDTAIQVGDANGGDEHNSVRVHVTNTSSTPCLTTGYTGVALLDAQGRQTEQAQRTPRGYWGGAEPTMIMLAPGAEATALLEGLGFDSTTGGACAPSFSLLVTLPNDTRSVAIAYSIPLCGEFEIHPLVAGDTGTTPASGN